MKKHSRRCRLLALFVVLFLGADLANSYAITSQYIGAQNNGDEHVLLFQLPQMISSQLQQQQHQQQPRYASIVQPSAEPQVHQSSEPTFVYHQKPAAEANLGQQISLTIPISTLPFKSSSSPSSSSSDNQRKQQAFRLEPTEANRQLVDYFLGQELVAQGSDFYRSRLQQQQQQQADSATVTVNPNRLHNEFTTEQQITLQATRHNSSRQHEQQDALKSSQHQQRMANLTSTIEQHLKQILRQHQLEQQQQQQLHQSLQAEEPHYTTTEAALTSTIPVQYEQEQPQPQLWRDAQQFQHNHQQREPLSDNSASLLARLANSSPELLQRLRALLNRASRQRQLSAANYTMSDNVKSLYPSGGQLSELAPNQQEPDGLSSLASGLNNNNNSNTMLSAFLANKNLSSHEEIKIPLVVVAMPRILSLKRNNLAASLTRNSSSGSGPTSSSAASADALNLIQETIRLSLANLTQSHEFSHPNRTSSFPSQQQSLTSTESILNATREARLLSQIYSDRNLFGQQQQQPEPTTTTSSPPHTMAPYARQFHLPALVSRYNYAVRPDATEHFAYPQQQQPPTAIRFHPHQNESQIELTGQQQQQQLRQFGHHQLSVPLIEKILADHPNTNSTGGNLLLRQSSFHRPAADNGAAGLEIRLIQSEDQQQQLQASQPQRIVYQEEPLSIVQHQRHMQQPRYEIQIQEDLPVFRQETHFGELEPFQEREFHQQPQRHHRPTPFGNLRNFTNQDAPNLDYFARAHWPEHLAAANLDRAAQAAFERRHHQSATASGRQMALEERLGRFKPLFRANSRADETRQDLVDPRQTLLRRDSSSNSKKSPKIMLMIV